MPEPFEKELQELAVLIVRAQDLLESAETIDDGFPCRADVIEYMRRAVLALHDAQQSWAI